MADFIYSAEPMYCPHCGYYPELLGGMCRCPNCGSTATSLAAWNRRVYCVDELADLAPQAAAYTEHNNVVMLFGERYEKVSVEGSE